MMILKVQRNVYIIYGVEEFSDQIIHMCMVQCGRSGGKECQESCANIFHITFYNSLSVKRKSTHDVFFSVMFGQC